MAGILSWEEKVNFEIKRLKERIIELEKPKSVWLVMFTDCAEEGFNTMATHKTSDGANLELQRLRSKHIKDGFDSKYDVWKLREEILND